MDAVVDPEALTCLGFVPQGSTLYNAWANCVCVSVTDDLVGKPLKVQKDGDSYVLSLDDSEVFVQAWTALRTQRDALLAASDWRVLPYSPLTSEEQAAWVTYRQALRDLPGSVQDPTSVEWPPVPSP